MLRYEVIVIPKTDNSMLTVVQYLVKDRWTGNIEVIWQAPNGQVRQSKYHPFDGSRDILPLDAVESPELKSQK